MFTKVKSLRVLLPFLLVASVLTVGSPPASAAVPVNGSYKCSSGVKDAGTPAYTITSGVVSSGSSCTGAVVIPDGVTSFGNDAFYYNTSLTSITIPNSVTSIGNYAFTGTSLTSVTIPNSVTSIGYQAFTLAASLTSVTLSNSITSIGDFAFYGATSLTSITIPNSVTSIGPVAFYNATSLTSVTIPNSVTSIGSFAFYGATSLTSITIPNSVTSIGSNAFGNTTSLTQYSYCGPANLTNTGLAGKTRISVCSLAGLSSTFSSASSYDGRFTVQVTNHDSAFTYAVTSSVGQVSISSTGLITVTGLRPDQSVTVTMTTSRSGYDTTSASITGRSQVAAMLPGTRPLVTISDSVITCTIGSYSATPTSSAFSLFVDGKHTSTIFSALGEYLPDWIIPWATSSTITRTATLSTATWSLQDAYKGKAITCATLAYSKNAIGFTASQVMVAR